jgi:large subunit ribosomal protein L3
MIEGAVPGAKGGWITVRDAVKKALPKEAPKPGKFREPVAEATPQKKAEAPAEKKPKAAQTEAAPKAEAKEGA